MIATLHSYYQVDLTNWGHVTQDLSAIDAHPIESRVRKDISAHIVVRL